MFNISLEPNHIQLVTDKFKDVIMGYRFSYPNQEPEISLANVLSYILSDRSNLYPTKLAMSQKMDELYALSIQTRTSAYGKSHGLEFRVKTLSPRYTQSNVLDEVQAFMMECLLHPLINEETFNEAKINLLNALGRYEDNPTVLGFQLAAQSLGKDLAISQFSQGSKEVLLNMRLEDVRIFHQKLLTYPHVLITSSDLKLQLPLTLSPNLQSLKLENAYVLNPQSFKSSHITKPIPQSTLTQLYRSQTHYHDQDYLAMRIMVIILGQLPNSLLFSEIREKRSLCYSISASSINFDGVVVIQTGVDGVRIEEVKVLIQEQLKKLQSGKFSKSLLSIAKKMMSSNMESIEDDRAAYLNFLYQRYLTQQDTSIDRILEVLRKISKDDVMAAANKLQLVAESIVEGQQDA